MNVLAKITMLYATAETTATYRRMNQQGMVEWRRHAEATMKQIPDLCPRYPVDRARTA